MGKKHKKESRKRKHHSRSRSRSIEKDDKEKKRHHKKKHKERKKEKHCKKLKKELSSSSSSEDEIVDISTPSPPPAPRISEREASPRGTPPPPPTSRESLSIEETNALRAKLGLKPLQVTEAPKPPPPPPPPPTLPTNGGTSTPPPPPSDIVYIEGQEGHFVHKPAENLTSKKETEKLRAKLTERKEKREIEKKYKKIKGIAAESDEEDSAASWVSKSRKIEKEKMLAAKRAQELDEMDAVFGVSDLINDEIKKEKTVAYTSRNLTGLKVEHDIESLADEKTVILTLKDKEILDEDNSDTLVNVNILDEERYKKNLFNKRQKPYGNDLYDDDEFAEFEEKNVLKKYDEEIDGEKKRNFVIGDKKAIITKDKVKAKLRANMSLESLDTNLQLASDYYSAEEMTKFKKPKKIKKIRKKPLKADDLLATSRPEEVYKDLGSRRIKNEPEEGLDVDDTAPLPDLSNVKIKVEEPEEETELALALRKARRLRQMKDKPLPSYLEVGEKIVQEVKMEDNSDEEAGGSIVLNSTAEFCRTLGDIPTYGLAGNREEAEQLSHHLMDFDKDNNTKWANDYKKEQMENEGGWQDAQMDNRIVEISNVEPEPILDAEPDLGSGVAGALSLAISKGYLEKETTSRPTATRFTHLQAQNYSIEDKSHGEEEKFGRRDRYMGPTTDFKEKDNYKPSINLEYIGDDGRLLSEKEAFRYMSHKFHGKGPGKNKIEKRMKKNEQEVLMKQMSSSDTPLGTLQMLQQKQKETQSPYVVLSGNKQITVPTAISKSKLGK